MKSCVDESEDPPTDDAEDPRNNVQRSRSNGDGTASHDGMEGFIDFVPPNPSYGDDDGARDEGASSSQGTQDVEQDHQGGPVHSNEQSVEPSGQDEPNEEVAAAAAAAGGGGGGGGAAAAGGIFDLEFLEELNMNALVFFEPVTNDPLPDEMIIDPLPDEIIIDPFPEMMRGMVNAMIQHPPNFEGHMLAERD